MIGFIGLSHLGIVTSISVASKGYKVVAYDPDSNLIQQLKIKELPIFEKGLLELLMQFQENILYTDSLEDIKKCDVVYISKDVPTNDANISDLNGIKETIWKVSLILNPGATLVILCQVTPGFSRDVQKQIVQKRNKEDIFVVYQVETLIFGDAVERALHPERYIIGYENGATPLPNIIKNLLEKFSCPILLMRYESAELAKISINLFLISSVTTTNIISEVCEEVGADWSQIEGALRLDKRIGKYAYLKPGLGIAGGNLERDLVNIRDITREYGIESSLFDSWISYNRIRREWIIRKLYESGVLSNPSLQIAFWGLAYKPGTRSLKNAPSLELINDLSEYSISVYDPEVSLPFDLDRKLITQTKTAIEAINGANLLIIMTAWPEFSSYDPAQILNQMNNGIIIDPNGIFSNKMDSSDKYLTMGR